MEAPGAMTRFEVVTPTATARGRLRSAELVEVGIWKSSRATGYLTRNDQADPTLVGAVTRVAFAPGTAEQIRHWILFPPESVSRSDSTSTPKLRR